MTIALCAYIARILYVRVCARARVIIAPAATPCALHLKNSPSFPSGFSPTTRTSPHKQGRLRGPRYDVPYKSSHRERGRHSALAYRHRALFIPLGRRRKNNTRLLPCTLLHLLHFILPQQPCNEICCPIKQAKLGSALTRRAPCTRSAVS